METANKTISLNFNAKITPIEKLNEQFTLCKCYVHAIGKNRNFSHFSKENVMRNIDSLNYIPVVGHLIEKEDGSLYMGSHDVEFLVENNELKVKSLTVPFGVVVEKSFDFEDVTESDGTIVTYLVADVILWTSRYPELMDAIYNNDIYFNESMEIDYSKWKQLDEDKNYTDIIDWNYSALCLLGKADDVNSAEHTEPCFPSSRVEPYQSNFSKTEFSKVMGELKEQLSFYFNKENSEEGGNAILSNEIRDAILQEFNLTLNDLNFEITEELTEEDFRVKLEEFANNKKENITLFSATYRQKLEALGNALSNDVMYDTDGNIIEETYHWVEDFDDVYVYVEKSHWTKNDYNTTYGRYTYTFDESALTASLTSEFEEMVKVWLTIEENQKIQEERANYDSLKTEFEDYKSNYSTPNEDVTKLIEYQNSKLTEERKIAEESVFAKYEEKIGDTTEFIELKTNVANYSIDALEKECIFIVGLHTEFAKETKKQEKVKFSVEKNTEEESAPYGGLFKTYLNK